MKANSILQALKTWGSKNSASICTGLGVAFIISAVGTAIVATVKAHKKVQEEPCETKKEVAKKVWKYYIPTASTLFVALLCNVAANKIHINDKAVMAGVIKLSEEAITTTSSAIAKLPEETRKTVEKAVTKEIRDTLPDDIHNHAVELTGDKVMICDPISRRYFAGRLSDIRDAVSILNRKLLDDELVTLSDFYDEIGLQTTDVSDDLGWTINPHCYRTELIELASFEAEMHNGTPCAIIGWLTPPVWIGDV